MRLYDHGQPPGRALFRRVLFYGLRGRQSSELKFAHTTLTAYHFVAIKLVKLLNHRSAATGGKVGAHTMNNQVDWLRGRCESVVFAPKDALYVGRC